ncbi:hypothetical protein BASA81_010590 [Batrachochytrium salamandrivorans]|nr:hypothetical protein BASA81_010590 [Batrachochytrium salamandrivorans]
MLTTRCSVTTGSLTPVSKQVQFQELQCVNRDAWTTPRMVRCDAGSRTTQALFDGAMFIGRLRIMCGRTIFIFNISRSGRVPHLPQMNPFSWRWAAAAVCLLLILTALPQTSTFIIYTAPQSAGRATLTSSPTTTVSPTLTPSFSHVISPYNWTLPQRGILFTKIPKTGSSTMYSILERVIRYSPGWEMAKPIGNAPELGTCMRRRQGGKAAWLGMIRHNVKEGEEGIKLFAAHACYHSEYMPDAQHWFGNQPPALITVMRSPLDQFTSKYRYVQMCCRHLREDPAKLANNWKWCAPLCSESGDYSWQTYVSRVCARMGCNEQKRYMGISQPIVQEIIRNYDLILISESMDESLALWAVKFGVPLRALPYLNRNTNSVIPKPIYSPADVTLIEKYLKYDLALYQLAKGKLKSQLESLTPNEQTQYTHVLSELRAANQLAIKTCTPLCSPIPGPSLEERRCWRECLERTMDDFWK